MQANNLSKKVADQILKKEGLVLLLDELLTRYYINTTKRPIPNTSR